MIRVPRRATMTRTVGGQFPKGFDPLKWGIPASMVGDVDKIALWNIVTTVDAYLSAASRRPRCCRPSIPRWWRARREPASAA